MRLKTVFIRFYKSFNFDYLRKYHLGTRQEQWEKVGEMWYPYVRIPIDPRVTTVVGANESGKSHLLTAIEKGITGADIRREDFCRYSNFFTVEKGKMMWPNFGFEWDQLSDEERVNILTLCENNESPEFDRFLFFRTGKDSIALYLPEGDEYRLYELNKKKLQSLQQLLPRIFRIDAEIALPDSVSIRALAEQGPNRNAEKIGRKGRFDLVDRLYDSRDIFSTQEQIVKEAQRLFSMFNPLWGNQQEVTGDPVASRRKAELNLARDLICNVANIDPDALSELYESLRDGKEGHANGIIQEINNRLAASLNFPRWWAQDKKFRLVVSPREFDLVFTIRDRTETDYSFNERSSGLKYFLSYYVQYRAHVPSSDRSEILLMDEPDTYLSSQGQQDLLKILEAFAIPNDGSEPVQVIYVTHSPFLINKNHAERIRVLEKGVTDEGTRVVKDAARNHYEPLRSAFGSFVGETVFIGNSNLMVEGPADQIFLAGSATHLRSRGMANLETLDLNNVTIVPAGSASSIPYMVYLASGRDIEQPAIAVLLDSDTAGDQAKKVLARGGPRRKQLLKDELILQIGELSSEDIKLDFPKKELVEIEDLVPLEICALAIKRYAAEFGGTEQNLDETVNANHLKDARKKIGSTFKAVEQIAQESFGSQYHIEKVGFARSVIEVVHELSTQQPESEALKSFEKNMKALFRRINAILRKAERDLTDVQLSGKLERLKKSFLQDYPNSATRERAHLLFEEVEASLTENLESDHIRFELARLRREFNVNDAFNEPIERFEQFREQLEGLQYAGRIATQEDGSQMPM